MTPPAATSSVPERIGFDALYLEQPMTGTGQYAVNLWCELRRAAVDARLLLPADAPPAVHDEAQPGKSASVAPPHAAVRGRTRKIWWEQVGGIRAARQAGVELVHVPYFAAPLRQVVPYVVTVHDAIPLLLPAYGGSAKMRAYLRLVSRAVRRVALVLTDSEHSRRDIERVLRVPDERIRVTPLAASALFQPAATEADRAMLRQLRGRFGLRRPFILNVGGFDQRKRLPQLLRGFAAALPSLPEPHDLVITGRPHTGNAALYPPLEPLIRELGIAEHVRLTGFVGEEDKRDLYRAAAAFAFVSEYEGFGLTPLEALACGAPVICSNRSSLPEVVGEAGLLIDPEPEPIARALIALLTDEELRADLVARAPRRAARFSWERTTRLTLDAYESVLSGAAAATRVMERRA
jgi:glycosyltransferase involved in cell wall biosynthesis